MTMFARRRRPESEVAGRYRDGVPLEERMGRSKAYFELCAQELPFAFRKVEQTHVTESYVAVPPALTITDERGDLWTLGLMTAPRAKTPEGEFAFDVLRNGKYSGECASRIERRSGKVRIFTVDGWKVWTGATFV